MSVVFDGALVRGTADRPGTIMEFLAILMEVVDGVVEDETSKIMLSTQKASHETMN